MGLTKSNGRCGAATDGRNSNNGGAMLKSFADFCVSVLLEPELSGDNPYPEQELLPSSVALAATAVREVANSYINGKDMEAPIQSLFEILTNDENGSKSTRNSRLPSLRRFPYETSDREIFYTDLLCCLENTLLHEYLSNRWDCIDDLIVVNQNQSHFSGEICVDPAKVIGPSSNTSGLPVEGDLQDDDGTLAALLNWYKTSGAYFQSKLQQDFKCVRKFGSVATILGSMRYESFADNQPETDSVGTFGTYSDNRKSEGTSREGICPRKDPTRRPTVYFLGGGMGAGKSTVVSYLKETKDPMFQNNPVIIEADAFKHSDPVFHAVNALTSGRSWRDSSGHKRVLQSIHEHSTDAANQQLVRALAERRDVVVDGTMTWMPYVQQTIAMVRDAHRHRYRLGPGYSKEQEVYWEKEECIEGNDGLPSLPYRVEMVGVTVDPGHAVARGIRRAIVTGRGVPVDGQLRSHRLYSKHFPAYAGERRSETNPSEEYTCLFDRVRLYDTSVVVSNNNVNTRVDEVPIDGANSSLNKHRFHLPDKNITPGHSNGNAGASSVNGNLSKGPKRHRKPPRCIAWKESPDQPLSVVPEAYQRFLRHQHVNDSATNVTEMYNSGTVENNHYGVESMEMAIPFRLREAFATVR